MRASARSQPVQRGVFILQSGDKVPELLGVRQREVTITLVQKQHLHVQLKRAYAPLSPEDGVRVFVDRLWPRSLRKAQAVIDRCVPA
jgi:hypothetical protein